MSRKFNNKKRNIVTDNLKNKNRQDNQTVFFVPSTPGAALLTRLQCEEDKLSESIGWGTKLVERPGTPLLHKFIRGFPMKERCSRGEVCPLCENTNQKCTTTRAVYQASCVLCQNDSDDEPGPS